MSTRAVPSCFPSWEINGTGEEVKMLSSGVTRLASSPSQSRTRIFSCVTIFALLLFSAIGFSPRKVKSDVGHSEFRVEYVLGSKMLLYRFLTVSVFCEWYTMTGRWIGRKEDPSYTWAILDSCNLPLCMEMLVVLRHPTTRELRQRGPSPSHKGLWLFQKKNSNSLHKCNVFLFAWKNQCKRGENLYGLSFHHLIRTLLAQSLFFF